METAMLDGEGLAVWSGIRSDDGPLRYAFSQAVHVLLEDARTSTGIAATGKGLLAVWTLGEKEDTQGLIRCKNDERLPGLVRHEAERLLGICWEKRRSALQLRPEEVSSKFDWALKKARAARILALTQQAGTKHEQHSLRKA